MTDIHSKKIRSYNMSQIRSKNTKPELILRKYLFSKGLRFRIHDKKLPGKPDIVLKKHRAVILVHGCFWHFHEKCKYSAIPASNQRYWKPKLLKNREKNNYTFNELRKMKWRVLIVWECQLKPNKKEKTLLRVYKNIMKPF